MSVHKRGRKWVVRYEEGGRQRQRTFDLREHAQDFDTEARRRKQLGTLHTLTAPQVALDEYVTDTWAVVHAPLLGKRTREVYAWAYDGYVSPKLGELALHQITPGVLARWQATMVTRNVSHDTIAKARTALSTVLRSAVDDELLGRNPLSEVRRPKAPLKPEVRPLAPDAVEAIRAVCAPRDAVLVSLLAYAGLRPQEARTLRWAHVGERTLTVGAPKTRQRRSVRLLDPLAADLREWRLRSGRPAGDEPVVPAIGGGGMSDDAFGRWVRGTFKPAVAKAKVQCDRPYDLRHSFASLLAHEGRSVVYIARQLGHSATESLRTYQHVIDELEDAPRITAQDAIQGARAKDNLRTGFARSSTNTP